MNEYDQFALVRDGRLLDYVEAADVLSATDAFVETFGEFPSGAIVINLTRLLETI